MSNLIPEARTKFCIGCEEELPAWKFHMNKTKPDGLAVRCKACIKISRKKTELEVVTENTLKRGFSKRPNS